MRLHLVIIGRMFPRYYSYGDFYQYDVNNTYNIDDWQRVKTFEEFKDTNIKNH